MLCLGISGVVDYGTTEAVFSVLCSETYVQADWISITLEGDGHVPKMSLLLLALRAFAAVATLLVRSWIIV